MTFKRCLLLTAISVAVIACSPKTVIVRQMTDLVDTGFTAFRHDDDLELVEKAIPANIKLLEAMLANSPHDRQLLIVLSRLYGSYAFGFIETRLEATLYAMDPSGSKEEESDALINQVNRYYEKGMGYALMALEKRSPGATEAFKKFSAIAPYLEKLSRNDVAALILVRIQPGAWVNHNLDSIRAVSRAHVAQKVMQRVIELDLAHNHAGAHLFLVVYFGSRPPMLGGSQEEAFVHYQRLKQIAGDTGSRSTAVV